jgi:uncharacterized membrane protein YjjB (DUF3815 family)
MDLMFITLQSLLWAGVAATGFAMLFNVPPRTLPGCALCGALGYTLRRLLIETGTLQIELATLVAATIVGFAAALLARTSRVPAPIYGVSGAIPMLPGVFGFRAMVELVQVVASGPDASADLLVAASVNALKTVLIVGAIALGIVVPNLLFQRRKPVV